MRTLCIIANFYCIFCCFILHMAFLLDLEEEEFSPIEIVRRIVLGIIIAAAALSVVMEQIL